MKSGVLVVVEALTVAGRGACRRAGGGGHSHLDQHATLAVAVKAAGEEVGPRRRQRLLDWRRRLAAIGDCLGPSGSEVTAVVWDLPDIVALRTEVEDLQGGRVRRQVLMGPVLRAISNPEL